MWVAYGPWEEATVLVTLVQVAGGWMAINEQIKSEFLAWSPSGAINHHEMTQKPEIKWPQLGWCGRWGRDHGGGAGAPPTHSLSHTRAHTKHLSSQLLDRPCHY